MDFLCTSNIRWNRKPKQIQNQSRPPPPQKNAYTKHRGEVSCLPLHIQKFAPRNGLLDFERKQGVYERQQSGRRRCATTSYDGYVESGEGLHLFKCNQPNKQQKKNKDTREPHLLFGLTQTPKKASATGRRQKRAKLKNNAPKSREESAAGTQVLRHDKDNSLNHARASNSPAHKANEGKGKKKQVFESYLTPEEVIYGLRRGELIQGQLRINPKNYQAAYLPSPDGARDVFLDGIVARNRALNGDVVVVQILPSHHWKHVKPDSDCWSSTEWDDQGQNLVLPVQKNVARFSFSGQLSVSELSRKTLQKTGKVVYIIEKKHSRGATGFLKFLPHKPFALFSPVDHRVPRINVPLSDCPKDISTSAKNSKTLYMCQITNWEADSNFAEGRLVKTLGQAGEVEPETEAILMEGGVDFSDFSDEVLDCLPKNLPWTIPPEEISERRDLRKECIFTIDPATARDLDDALSCKRLPDGNFEVGVHITDVSYFVKRGSALDAVASQRATSVHLVQKVIPMLPRQLSEELCSLNPHCDRLAFSVIWKITSKGNILRRWFGRSVVRSCVKLSYDHAQSMIEAPGKRFSVGELPPVEPAHRVDDVHQAVLDLNSIAQNLRARRLAGGAVGLDRLKMNLSLDQETMMPLGCSVYQSRDSNKLVEEFMLLANISTAKQIYSRFPDLALLRCHPPPKFTTMHELQKVCDQSGTGINLSSAGALHQSLHAAGGDDKYSSARKDVLAHMCSRPMLSPSYICSGAFNKEKHFNHYALNVALYTHFTSPIRRYADVIVHRLLAASLEGGPDLSLTTKQVQAQASHCNDKMMASKRVQKHSNELFFELFVKKSGHLDSDAVVTGVLDESFDVLVLKYGVQKRVYCKSISDLLSFRHRKEGRNSELILVWAPKSPGEPPVVQLISLFTAVDVLLKADSSSLKCCTTLRRPQTQETFFL